MHNIRDGGYGASVDVEAAEVQMSGKLYRTYVIFMADAFCNAVGLDPPPEA